MPRFSPGNISGAPLAERCGVTPSKQRAEPLLPEVLIVGQDVREAANPHHDHGSAVGEAVPLVRAVLVVSESGEERVVGLRDQLHRAVLQDRSGGQRGDRTEMATPCGEECKELGQHLIGRDQTPRGERAGCGEGRVFH